MTTLSIVLSHLFYGALFTVMFAVVGILSAVNGYEWRIRAYYADYLIVFILFAALWTAVTGGTEVLISKVFSTMLEIFVFNLILISAIRNLREKCIAAHTASLWVASNCLYIFYYIGGADKMISLPLIYVRMPEKTAAVIFAVWAAGFLAYMIYAVYTHIRYMGRVKCGSRRVDLDSDEPLNEIFRRIYGEFEERFGMHKPPELILSPNASTPVAAGFYRYRIILPDTEYSQRQLEWIFRHEFVHIRNRDANLKLFLELCNAVFWFFPPVRKAVTNAADDFELCCDEELLEGKSEEDRRFYAELIISSSGNSRGFTTCLSEGGKSARYRLREIMHPVWKSTKTGYVLLAVSLMLLLSCFHLIGFSSDFGTAADMIIGSSAGGKTEIISGSISEAELEEFLDTSQVVHVGEYDSYYTNTVNRCEITAGGERYQIEISEKLIEVLKYRRNGTIIRECYYITG